MNHIPKEIGHEKHRDWASSQVGTGEPGGRICQLGSQTGRDQTLLRLPGSRVKVLSQPLSHLHLS